MQGEKLPSYSVSIHHAQRWAFLGAWLETFMKVDIADPIQQRRGQILNILLVGLGVIALIIFAFNQFDFVPDAGPMSKATTAVTTSFFLVSSIVIAIINRYVSNRLAALLFLCLITVGLFLGDTPYETIWGRNMIVLAMPILFAGLILDPLSTFVFATIISSASLYMARANGLSPNVIGILIFYALALIAWITTRSLEQAVLELKNANLQLDKRVAERTIALNNSVKALQLQIRERMMAEEMLREARDELEGRVARRTEQLSQTNEQLRLEILEREKAEKELEQHLQILAQKNEELEQFAYVASHDLREPLRKVRSFTELLSNRYEGQLDEKADRYISYIVDGASRMQVLISDLLAYSRVGRQSLTIEHVDFNHVMVEVVSDLSVLIAENNAAVHVEPLPCLMADRTRMHQLLQNLLSNAIKFRGENIPNITISAAEDDDGWTFAVQDNGIGINEAYADRIFLIFQRLHKKQAYSGTGIGLAICKKIIQDHNGRIWFESAPNHGTTFFFHIPTNLVELKPLLQKAICNEQ